MKILWKKKKAKRENKLAFKGKAHGLFLFLLGIWLVTCWLAIALGAMAIALVALRVALGARPVALGAPAFILISHRPRYLIPLLGPL
ncbi:hypothetical protein [Sporosarcina jiandibaonis]|uniref:hypothetical protein n=1 Tax=Sporosarcina jiandibaonis TaxID=2715535 RepID=UPI001555C1AE|nr:hypothetical protein [Sporosarcina jiandibaonis]